MSLEDFIEHTLQAMAGIEKELGFLVKRKVWRVEDWTMRVHEIIGMIMRIINRNTFLLIIMFVDLYFPLLVL